MQSRVKQMEKRIDREIEDKEGLLVDIEQPVDLKLMTLSHHKKVLVDIKEYGLRYKGAEASLFDNLTFSINQGDRIALHGENGCGKSTLIKMLLNKAGYDISQCFQRDEFLLDNNQYVKNSSVGRSETTKNISGTEHMNLDGKLMEHGTCELVSGLVISYISQDTSKLRGSITDYCK